MRVAICQPLIPAYRLPLFERLGALPNVALTVFAGVSSGSLPGLRSGNSFRFVLAPVQQWGWGMRTQWAQISAVIRHRFDLLIIPWDAHYLTLAPCLAAARASGTLVVLWGHGYSQQPRQLTDIIRNTYGRLSDAVLLYSRRVATRLVEDGGFLTDRVFVAANAVDQAPIQAARQHWSRQPQMLRDFQRQHGLDPAHTIVFLSRLESTNRVDLLLQAFRSLCRARPTLKTVIIGDGSHRQDLEYLAKAMGISRQIIFTGAIYDELALAPWMLSATLFCYPRNIGLSLLHAFGYALPTITSDNLMAQNPEIEALEHGDNGLLYRDTDVTDLTRRCGQLLDNPVLQKRLSENALRTVLSQYSMDNMIGGFTRLFAWAKQHLVSTDGMQPRT